MTTTIAYNKNLFAMVTKVHKQSKPTAEQGSPKKLKLNNFKPIEAMGLKIMHRGPLEMHCFRTIFHENLPSGSKVIIGGRTDSIVT
jgi:hypothetical protein